MEPYLLTTGSGGHVDPSKFTLKELARIRGCMWPVRGPWRFGPRPGQPSNITALEYLYCYGSDPRNLSDEQKGMLATYRAAYPGPALCMVPFGPINAQSYHGQYPDVPFTTSATFEVWLDWLQVLWDHGIAPIVFLHPDNWTYEETVALYDPLIRNNARAKRLIRLVVPSGWEPAGYNWSSVTWALYFAWGRDLLPNALCLMHNACKSDGSPYDAPIGTDERYNDDGQPNAAAAGWQRCLPNLHGWLIQNGPFDCAPSENKQLADEFAAQFSRGPLGPQYHGFRWHFENGVWGPTRSAWGDGIGPMLYNAEVTSYNAYHNDFPYAKSCAWGDHAMANDADGYLDGGTVAVS